MQTGIAATVPAALPGRIRVRAMSITTEPPLILDGATLTPKGVARIARGGAPVRIAAEAQARNDAARHTVEAWLAAGEELYGVTTGVGAMRAYRVPDDERESYSLRLLRSHAGVAPELLDGLVGALNCGLSPFTRALGSLGTGDLTDLADIGLALLGEGQMWRGQHRQRRAPRRRRAAPARRLVVGGGPVL